MRIPEHKIDEIRNAANIVDVISKYVRLSKSGSNYKGLCPFHNEKTPSFMVSQDKQIFKCFGCQAGGNVFNFIMEYHKISFIEAAKELADDYGIPVNVEDAVFEGEQPETEILYDLNVEAARFYSNQLLETGKNPALKYLEKRYIVPKTMRAFGLGYAPPGRTELLNHFVSKKLDIKKAAKLGLFGEGDAGSYYDRFKSRIIFPIFSPNGRVVAFAGRIIAKNQNGPKYWNSPESDIYHKSRILYGLSTAKEDIRKEDYALIVEGYMDLIALYQNGIKNVVAVSGTALTPQQVKLLSRFTNNVFLLFDADSAGVQASMRSIEILLRQNMNVKIISLPEGEDPDSFVNRFGKPAFQEKIEEAENFLDFQTSIYKKEGKLDDAEKSAEAIRDLIKPLALLPDELKQATLLQSISDRFGLRKTLLESELKKAINQERRYNNRERDTVRPSEKKSVQSGEKEADPNYKLFLSNELDIIRLLYEGSPAAVEYIFQRIGFEEIEHPVLRQLAQMAYDEFEVNGVVSVSAVLDNINDETLRNTLLHATTDPHSLSQTSVDLIHDDPAMVTSKEAVDTLKKNRINKIKKRHTQLHKLLQETADEARKMEILAETKKLNEEIEEINRELAEN